LEHKTFFQDLQVWTPLTLIVVIVLGD